MGSESSETSLSVRWGKKTSLPVFFLCGYSGDGISSNNPRIATKYQNGLLYCGCRRCQGSWVEKPKSGGV